MKIVAITYCMAQLLASILLSQPGRACTAITLQGADGTVVFGRTMEWADFDLEPRFTLVPRGLALASVVMPDGKAGAAWHAKYGFAGIDILGQPAYVDAVNEKGLTVSMLYFPGFAVYQEFNPAQAGISLSPDDVVTWIASNYASTQEVRDSISKVRVVPVVQPALGFATPAHWIVTDPGKQQIVIEYLGGQLRIYDAPLGVMTNAPPYDWHITNLRNYLNLRAVAWTDIRIADLDIKPLGVGSGMIGLPGDFTPPSRFIRATAFSQTACKTTGGYDTVRELFRILDNFNVPIAAVASTIPPGLKPLEFSGTQYTTAVDLKHMIFYYHTDSDRTVRKVNLKAVDFGALGNKIMHQPLRFKEENAVVDVTPKP